MCPILCWWGVLPVVVAWGAFFFWERARASQSRWSGTLVFEAKRVFLVGYAGHQRCWPSRLFRRKPSYNHEHSLLRQGQAYLRAHRYEVGLEVEPVALGIPRACTRALSARQCLLLLETA